MCHWLEPRSSYALCKVQALLTAGPTMLYCLIYFMPLHEFPFPV